MGRNRKTMKFVLALLFVAAVSAHWTHDDSLAREIGPPPGEEDVEVANLGESAGAVKQYRITFGTQVVGGKLGASQSQFKVALKGAKPKAPAAGQAIAWTQDTTWKEHADNVIKYYQGVHLTYALAKTTAPELHPGMSPLVDTLQAGCSNLKNGKMKPCDAATAKTLNACEPGAKACKNAIGQAMVAYAYGKTHQLINGINFSTKASGFKKAFCSSPWRPAFVKISTNDAQTGVGDGTYYIAPCDASTLQVGVYVMSGGPGQPDIYKGPVDLIAASLAADLKKCPKEQNAILTKCAAATCEEEMDTKLGMMDAEKYEFADI